MEMVATALNITFHQAAFVREDRECGGGKHSTHSLPIVWRQRLFNEFNPELLKFGGKGDGLLHGPGGVGIHSEYSLRVTAQLPDDSEIIGCPQLDFVNRPTVEFLHLGDHLLDRINADCVIA